MSCSFLSFVFQQHMEIIIKICVYKCVCWFLCLVQQSADEMLVISNSQE
jgi:hypothetical protein